MLFGRLLRCRIQDAWGWCTGMTQRDDIGRVVAVGFRVGNSCTPVVDSCQCMAKPIQYCKLKKKRKNRDISKAGMKHWFWNLLTVCFPSLPVSWIIFRVRIIDQKNSSSLSPASFPYYTEKGDWNPKNVMGGLCDSPCVSFPSLVWFLIGYDKEPEELVSFGTIFQALE